jgi:hypothetical protein
MMVGKVGSRKWLQYFQNKIIGYVQAALFVTICFMGYYVDSVGLGGGSATPDRLHAYLVKFGGNPPRYLTE